MPSKKFAIVNFFSGQNGKGNQCVFLSCRVDGGLLHLIVFETV